VQALVDISRSALCCHKQRNTCIPIANPPNSIHATRGHLLPFLQVTPGSVQ